MLRPRRTERQGWCGIQRQGAPLPGEGKMKLRCVNTDSGRLGLAPLQPPESLRCSASSGCLHAPALGLSFQPWQEGLPARQPSSVVFIADVSSGTGPRSQAPPKQAIVNHWDARAVAAAVAGPGSPHS